uniref:Probable protein-export membrane protein SecG n=1 Tax=Caulacanthus okamurae TaxID=152008 RepID=A0A6H1U8Z4_9FLOR|nr:preprotein translocase subunit G [Caulacanthus okamurae]QIZ74680.1 preprotein translocase subunit G [Caulacanthus okamurae]
MTIRLIWYLISITTICLILINNPKGSNLSSFGNRSSFISSTRSTQQTLQFIIAFNIFLFLFITILSVLFLYIN